MRAGTSYQGVVDAFCAIDFRAHFDDIMFIIEAPGTYWWQIIFSRPIGKPLLGVDMIALFAF
ncbi:MAG: hypothetical protein D6B25_03925 [Desulfobulbaceae bacterium]|nr:MAG: hypothetical protein D6B25_03925 [Desulfobulbaceae bacterium]